MIVVIVWLLLMSVDGRGELGVGERGAGGGIGTRVDLSG